MDINALIDYLAYFAWIVDAGGVIASAILIVMGRVSSYLLLFPLK